VSPSDKPALCVAIHDVAPATWTECLHLLHAVRAVADIPLTWLVVPRYHCSPLRSHACESTLEKLMGQGHELVLHGYTHLDPAPVHGFGAGRLLRTVYTQREGEFSRIGRDEARRRLELGLRWFRERGWPVTGFVAPAWLLGQDSWLALEEQLFTYTTTYARIHLLRLARSQRAPALVYAARNAGGRLLSPPLASGMAALARGAPLVRLALHPRDAHHPALVRHAQGLIERLLLSRTAMTKQAFADRMAGQNSEVSTVSSGRQDPSSGYHMPH
jgi:predicted deacetylase